MALHGWGSSPPDVATYDHAWPASPTYATYSHGWNEDWTSKTGTEAWTEKWPHEEYTKSWPGETPAWHESYKWPTSSVSYPKAHPTHPPPVVYTPPSETYIPPSDTYTPPSDTYTPPSTTEPPPSTTEPPPSTTEPPPSTTEPPVEPPPTITVPPVTVPPAPCGPAELTFSDVFWYGYRSVIGAPPLATSLIITDPDTGQVSTSIICHTKIFEKYYRTNFCVSSGCGPFQTLDNDCNIVVGPIFTTACGETYGYTVTQTGPSGNVINLGTAATGNCITVAGGDIISSTATTLATPLIYTGDAEPISVTLAPTVATLVQRQAAEPTQKASLDRDQVQAILGVLASADTTELDYESCNVCTATSIVNRGLDDLGDTSTSGAPGAETVTQHTTSPLAANIAPNTVTSRVTVMVTASPQGPTPSEPAETSTPVPTPDESTPSPQQSDTQVVNPPVSSDAGPTQSLSSGIIDVPSTTPPTGSASSGLSSGSVSGSSAAPPVSATGDANAVRPRVAVYGAAVAGWYLGVMV